MGLCFRMGRAEAHQAHLAELPGATKPTRQPMASMRASRLNKLLVRSSQRHPPHEVTEATTTNRKFDPKTSLCWGQYSFFHAFFDSHLILMCSSIVALRNGQAKTNLATFLNFDAIRASYGRRQGAARRCEASFLIGLLRERRMKREDRRAALIVASDPIGPLPTSLDIGRAKAILTHQIRHVEKHHSN
jgi:hypothetical protein